MMYKELKKLIIDWMFENEFLFQRLNGCVEAFRPYIYGPDGNFLIGGEAVYEFIKKADALIYGK